MTTDAQAALRRIIEAHAATTRFAIICNYISKIIDPLASRCVKFRFSPISMEAQRGRLKQICHLEDVKLESEAVIDKLIAVTEGDLRRSINTLQTCASFGKDRELTVADIESISGVIPRKTVVDVHNLLDKKGVTYTEIQGLCEGLILDGWDCQLLVSQLLDFYLLDPACDKLADVKKARISELIAATDFQLLSGGNEELNLLNALSSISQVLSAAK